MMFEPYYIGVFTETRGPWEYRVKVERNRRTLRWSARIIGTAGTIVEGQKSSEACRSAVEHMLQKLEDWKAVDP